MDSYFTLTISKYLTSYPCTWGEDQWAWFGGVRPIATPSPQHILVVQSSDNVRSLLHFESEKTGISFEKICGKSEGNR